MNGRTPTLLAILATLSLVALPAASTPEGERESYAELDVEYGVLQTADGASLRTIVTRPRNRTGPLPAILFVQWLSCDTIALRPASQDGWSLMLRRLIQESGALVWRTEKSGVGDSRGPACDALDYETELAHHQAAFAKLRAHPDVDPARIVIFGASMGTTMAPLIARGQPVCRVATWGGGARTWYERQLALDRRALELSGSPVDAIAPAMLRRAEFELLYLVHGLTPAQIAQSRPDLAEIAGSILGLDATGQYGRPYAFHWQAARQNWAAAWSEVNAPVLALLGEYDWYEDPRSAELIAQLANRRAPGQGTFHLVPRMDHHFSLFPSAEAAFRDEQGVANPDPAVDLLLEWLQDCL